MSKASFNWGGEFFGTVALLFLFDNYYLRLTMLKKTCFINYKQII